MCPGMKLFSVKFRRIFEVLRLQGSQKKFWARFHDLCIKNEAVFREVQPYFGSSLLQGHRKNFGRIFTIYASKNEAVCCVVQTHFGRFPLVRLVKSSGRIFTIYVSRKQTFLTSTFRKNALATLCFTILRSHKFFCVVWTHCEVLDFDILWECFESEHIWTARAPTNCDARVWLHAKHFQASVGPAPQTCFVICELWKSEQILWILTWGKLRFAKLSWIVHTGLCPNFYLCFEFNAPSTDSKTCFLSGLSRLLSCSRFSSYFITWLVNDWLYYLLLTAKTGCDAIKKKRHL